MVKDEPSNNQSQNEDNKAQAAIIDSQKEEKLAGSARASAGTGEEMSRPWHPMGLGFVSGIGGGILVALLIPFFQGNPHNETIGELISQIERLNTEQSALSMRVDAANTQSNSLKEEATSLREQGVERQARLEEITQAFGDVRTTQAEHTMKIQDLTQATVNLHEDIDAVQSNLAATINNEGTDGLFTLEKELVLLTTRLDKFEQQLTDFRDILQKQQKDHDQKINEKLIDINKLIGDERNRLDSLQPVVDSLKSELTSLAQRPLPTSDQSVALLIAANNLKAAIERGGSYLNELQIFTPLAPHDMNVEVLKKYATIGLPNLAQLSTRFAKIADQIAATQNNLDEDASLTDRLLRQGQQLYSSRPVGDVEGEDAAAIAARMEVAIGEGDFSRALTEAKNLPSEALIIAADFVELLQIHQTVDALMSQLIATVLQEEKDANN